MRKVIFLTILSIFVFFLSSSNTLAFNDPLGSPNNSYGIHIFNEQDLNDAASLVNSNGGDWGYVTFVVTEAERDHDRWQKAFDQMRRLHLIPIVRIATKLDGTGWQTPNPAEINNWVAFLNSLNWVIQDRYVIIGNEPNHSAEWGGKIDPAGYAAYLSDFSTKLRRASPDFFILPAALDASAKNTSTTMDEGLYLRKMMQAKPDVFNSIDGWNSHSYPNPDFSGVETAIGRGTIMTFDWELTYLQSLGISRNLPVFITETGWSDKSLSDNEVGRRLTYAFQNVWSDQRIVAVTPFILNYPNPPFVDLSWKNPDKTFRSYYKDIAGLPKAKGEPVQIEGGQILAAFAQPVSTVGGDFYGAILAKNTGQTIWNFNDVSIGSENGKPFIKNYSFNDLEPSQLGLIIFKAQSPDYTGIYSSSLFLKGKKGQQITNGFTIESVITKLDSNQVVVFLRSLLAPVSLKFK